MRAARAPAAAAGMTVLVTGGSGFLGKELIRQLAKCREVAKIVALDVRQLPSGFQLDPGDAAKLEFVQADIRDKQKLIQAFSTVHCVLHTAAIIELGLYPDVETMNCVNIEGTANVIAACQQCGVGSLIFTGTSEMGRCYQPVENFNEEQIDATEGVVTVDLLNGYASSKRAAEKLVLQANGDGNLLTISLRPVGIYGEGDQKFIPTFIRTGKRFCHVMPHLGSKTAKIQRVYVGNVAWAHICALRCLVSSSADQQAAAGRAYLVTDDTPLNSNFQFVRPFLLAHGIRLLDISIPLIVVFMFWWLLEFICKLLKPIVRLPLQFTKNELYLACTTCFYDTTRIRKSLKYSPIYSPKQSLQRSAVYYAGLQL